MSFLWNICCSTSKTGEMSGIFSPHKALYSSSHDLINSTILSPSLVHIGLQVHSSAKPHSVIQYSFHLKGFHLCWWPSPVCLQWGPRFWCRPSLEWRWSRARRPGDGPLWPWRPATSGSVWERQIKTFQKQKNTTSRWKLIWSTNSETVINGSVSP